MIVRSVGTLQNDVLPRWRGIDCKKKKKRKITEEKNKKRWRNRYEKSVNVFVVDDRTKERKRVCVRERKEESKRARE